MTKLRSVPVGLALLLCATSAFGQMPPIAPGARVRTTVVGVQRSFTLVELRSDSIIVSDTPEKAPLRLALSDLDGLEVSASTRNAGQRMAAGAGKGIAIAGTGGAMVVGILAATDGEAAAGAAFGFLFFGSIGLVIGAIVGLASDGQAWVPVPLR